MRNFSKDDLLDMDFKAYLASSSDESGAEGERETEGAGDKKENDDGKNSQVQGKVVFLEEQSSTKTEKC